MNNKVNNKECKYCKLILDRPYKIKLHEKICKYNPDVQNSFNPNGKIGKYSNGKLLKYYKEQIKTGIINPTVGKLIKKEKLCRICNKKFEIIDNEKYDINQKKYCSISCANKSRKLSEETKRKISKGMKNSKKFKNFVKHRRKENKKLLKNSCKIFYNKCKNCNNIFISRSRNKRACNSKCLSSIRFEQHKRIQKIGGFGKKGTYKGIRCDSSWELAYVIYNLEHGIEFKRNTKGFEYIYNGKKHIYYPDFIEGNTYIEIKGNIGKEWFSKLKFFNQHLKILYKKEMKKYLNYVINKYGKNFLYLYDDNNEGIKHICKGCNKEFKTFFKAHRNRKYCSKECYFKNGTASNILKRKKIYNYNCIKCGEKIISKIRIINKRNKKCEKCKK